MLSPILVFSQNHEVEGQVKTYENNTETQTVGGLYNRANKKFTNKDYYGAIADYTKAIEIDPNYAKTYYNRGIAKIYLNDQNGACKDARKAQELGADASELISLICN